MYDYHSDIEITYLIICPSNLARAINEKFN